MEQIFKTYGKFLLTAVVVILVFDILFFMPGEDGQRGIFKIIGAKADTYMNEIDYGTYVDFQTYMEEGAKEAPVFTYKPTQILFIGENHIMDIIKVVDYAGNDLNLHLTSILDPYGNEIIANYNHVTSEIQFERAGIYTVTAWAIDEGARVTSCEMKIPVNGR